MSLKYLAIALFNFALIPKHTQGAQSLATTTDNLKKDLRDEFANLGFKMLVGVVLTSTVVFAIFYFAKALQLSLSELDNPIFYQIIVFGITAATAFILLFLLFRKSLRAKAREAEARITNRAAISVPNVLFEFADGFMDGYTRPHN
jgi:hypothetical protein